LNIEIRKIKGRVAGSGILKHAVSTKGLTFGENVAQ
jgi:hypothetical protein